MKIDSNTTVEEVKQKTKDAFYSMCNIKDNENDNGKELKELFDMYRTNRLSSARKSFSGYDFIRLFLSYLVVKGITKIDTYKLKFDLVRFYKNDKYRILFEEISLKHQIEGDFVELDDYLASAQLYGLLSKPIQGTNNRKIFIEEPSKIYNSYSGEYTSAMHQLVTECVNLDKTKVGIVSMSDKSKYFMTSFIEKLDSSELKKDICPQVVEGFNPTYDSIEECIELLDSGILDDATIGEGGKRLSFETKNNIKK